LGFLIIPSRATTFQIGAPYETSGDIKCEKVSPTTKSKCRKWRKVSLAVHDNGQIAISDGEATIIFLCETKIDEFRIASVYDIGGYKLNQKSHARSHVFRLV